MDGAPPFLARLAHVTGDELHASEATRELLAYARLLQDERTGLLTHGFEASCGKNGQLWGRGNGWAVMGFVETLAWLPESAPHRDELVQRLAALLDAIAARQHDSGLWPVVLDRPETPLDTTLAAMFVSALDRARAIGLLPHNRYGTTCERARAAVLDRVSPDATPIGELEMYATRPFGLFPWGQGPLLLMLSGPEPG
jgi:unsaturated rhamnogalacturonyl hydrolase